MFEAYASGVGLRKITKMLEERGVLTKRGGKLWHDKSLRYLLQNQVYTGIRYYNRMTRAAEPQKGRKHAPLTYRDRGVWVGVPVPAIVSQELFDRVQARLQEVSKEYRHPMTHYLLSGLVECDECGTSFCSYRRYLGNQLVTGKRSIYHRAAYKCVSSHTGYCATAARERVQHGISQDSIRLQSSVAV